MVSVRISLGAKGYTNGFWLSLSLTWEKVGNDNDLSSGDGEVQGG